MCKLVLTSEVRREGDTGKDGHDRLSPSLDFT